jgi:chlorobactene glucosyltransferase
MLLLRFLVVAFNFATQPYLPHPDKMVDTPRVSVLIPVRNEAQSLPKLLLDLQKIDYKNLEIIVCNDNSTDATLDVLQAYNQLLPNMFYFTNDELPKGWIGKNYACHQLSQRATGEYFLFLDADVRLQPNALTRAIQYVQKHNTTLLSIFPRQIMETRGEGVTVPIMNWILLSFLPLLSVRIPWFTSLSAANGQFMLFNADQYRKNLWHKLVWNQNVDDILIARAVKKARLKIAVLLGADEVWCRMYESKRQAVAGFSRNIHHYFGGSRFWMSAFILLSWLRLPLFAVFAQWWMLAFSMVMVLLMKCMVSKMSGQSIMGNLWNHPAQLWALVLIGIGNLGIAKSQRFEWKGRQYDSIPKN